MPNDVRIRIDGELSNTFQQAISQAQQLIDQLQQSAQINIGGAFGGGSGPGAGRSTAGGASVMVRQMASARPGRAATYSGGGPGQTVQTMQPAAGGPGGPGSPNGPGGTGAAAPGGAGGGPPVTQMFNIPSLNTPLGRYGLSAGRAMMMAGGMAASEYLNAATQAELTGRTDQMAVVGARGSLWGGTLGALGGAFFGPWGALIGSGAGAHVGSAVEQYMEAGRQRELHMIAQVLPTAGMTAALRGSFYTRGTIPGDRVASPNPNITGPPGPDKHYLAPGSLDEARKIAGWAERTSKAAGFFWGEGTSGDPDRKYSATGAEIAGAYNTMASALLQGGIDPTTKIGPDFLVRPYAAAKPGSAGPGYGSKMISSQAGLGIDLIRTIPVAQSGEYAKWLTQNMAARYGRALEPIAKQVAPIWSSLPETDGNIVDILGAHGAEATFRFLESGTPIGQEPPVKIGDLMHKSAMIRGLARQAQRGSMMMRGKGATMRTAYEQQAGEIESLPGGKDSVTYLQGQQNIRSAIHQDYDDADALEYELPMMRLRNQEARLAAAPFAPGNSMVVQIALMGQRKKRMGTLSDRMEYLKGRGMLTERDELRFESEIEALRTENVMGIASLSEGIENRLPALSAGMTSSYGRFNSNTLAAMHLSGIGHPGQLWGAGNGRQARTSREYFASIAGEAATPRSRTETVNNVASDGRSVALLERMTKALETLVSGRGGNPGAGGAQGAGNPRQKPWSGSQ